jgi:hypothetical protein
MNWVLLSLIDGNSIGLRADLLTRMVGFEGYTEVFTQDGAVYSVSECVEEILEYIDAESREADDPLEDF